MVSSGEARKVSRRRILRWATQTAAVVGGLTIGRPGHLAAAANGDPVVARTAVTAVSPARKVHDVLLAAPANAVALTVDDGPDPLWTPQMLDLLHRTGVRATFSLIGAQARAYPGLVKRILAEGHGVTNHSMTHPQPFSRGNSATIRQQIIDAQSAITDAGGVAPKLFRAPGGDWSAAVFSAVQDLQMVPLGWDIARRTPTIESFMPAACRASGRHPAVPRRRRQSCTNHRVVAHRAARTQGPWPAVRDPVGLGQVARRDFQVVFS